MSRTLDIATVKPGDPIKAADFNALVAAMQATLRTSMRSGVLDGMGGAVGNVAINDQSQTIVYAKNAGGATLNRWDAVVLSAPVVAPSSDAAEFAYRVIFTGAKPTSDDADQWVGVCLEEIAVGGFGRVVALGITPAKMQVVASGDRWARTHASNARLTGGRSGQARILWKESGTGEKWALLMLDGPTIPKSGVFVGKITAVTGSVNATYSAEAIDDADVSVTGASPINRPMDTDNFDFDPATTGDTCLLVRRMDTDTVQLVAFELVQDTSCP